MTDVTRRKLENSLKEEETTRGSVKKEEKGITQPEKWDYEADLVVVGAGGAGLSAAVQGPDEGIEVIVLEMLPVVGGSTAICNGGIAMGGTLIQKEQGIEDSPELFYKDLVEFTAPGNRPELIKVHVDNALDLYEWLANLGVKFLPEGVLGTMGMSVPREHHTEPAVLPG